MSFCPDCLQKNISSKLISIGDDKRIKICNNDDCIYIEKNQFLNQSLISKGPKSKPKKIKFESETSSEAFEINIDDCDINFTSSEGEDDDKILTQNTNIDFNCYELRLTQRHFQALLDSILSENGLFNWFCLPLMLKFHVKLCYFLIINLNMFDYRRNSLVRNMKEFYYKTERIVNNVPRKLISLVTFKFIKFLFEEHQIFKLSYMSVLNMSERVLRSLGNFTETLHNKDLYKTIYSYNSTCIHCENVIKYLKEDISVKLQKDYKYKDNTFSYFNDCKKCLGQCEVTINIERLSNFFIFDLPNGTSNDFKSMMSTSFSTRPDMHLQAIIELCCPLPIDDVPEKNPNLNEFIFKKCIKQSIQFRIHFRNTDGWYCIDSKSGLIVKHMFGSEVKINLSNVRLLIYGHCNDTSAFKSTLGELSLYEELKEYKHVPWGSESYPREEMKYWLCLFKYRDFYMNRPNMPKQLVLKIVDKIILRLNYNLELKKKRIVKKRSTKINEGTNNRQKAGRNELVDQDMDEEEVLQHDGTLEAIKYRDLKTESLESITSSKNKVPKSEICVDSDEKSYTFQSTQLTSVSENDPFLPLSALCNTTSPEMNWGIDRLIECKRRKMSEKKLL